MSRRVRIDAEASAELRAAAHWYEAQRAGLGADFLAATDEVLRRIAAWPHAARPVDGVKAGLTVRRAPVAGFPYYVAYLEEPSGLLVLAVAHNRRKPNYWRKRLQGR